MLLFAEHEAGFTTLKQKNIDTGMGLERMACAGILDVLETRHVEQCYFGHIHGNQASKKAVRGNYHGIKMHLISCDYVNFMPILVK